MANARLMEDNESYQLLLQEKTLHGDFGKGDFSYMTVSANQDALNALEGRSNAGDNPSTPAASLADELGALGGDESPKAGDDDTARRLETELRAAKDQNKALTLYINKIIERLLQHQEFEHILDQSSDFKPGANLHKDLPPPPSEAQGMGASILQRAKSIAIGTGAPRPKPRPMSMYPPQVGGASALNNPDTAPSIPIGLGRSQSTARRPGRPMSEQLTGAAGIVNAMYKGPDGPLSPALSTASSSARHSQTFFSGGNNSNGGGRVPSASAGAGSAGNFPGMRSETSSVSGDSAADGTPSTTSAGASPPRSTVDRSTTLAGNKPRPLRLVQENHESQRVENKRASWIGWAQSAWSKKDENENMR